ncbi:MAG TPA: hypothetical protein VJV75_06045 [Candidatus Polarisedimenticolia bacterium]|nr:hypothetical protein [Candidatus Polarisedimenticolia bacterium]
MKIRACRALCISLLAIVTAGCGLPGDEQVKAAFLKENPTFTVTSVASGEGDGSTVYMHIRFIRPGNHAECEVVWGYQEAKPEWVVFHKSEPGLPGTLCEGCTSTPCP